MIRVACPKCAKPLGLPDNASGKKVKCPKCQQVFQAPLSSTATVAVGKTAAEIDEATPYLIQEDKPSPEQIKKSAQGEAVDQMVVDANRVRHRNKAWELVGLPAKFIKRAALSACIFWVFLYLFLTMVIVLANHNMEAAEKTEGFINTGGIKSLPRYLFVQDVIPMLTPQRLPPLPFWGIITGGLVVALLVYGLQLAGAESMKKLENYRLSMFSMIVGTLSLNLFGIWGLLTLLNKDVQYEFRVSKRRSEGKSGEELYEEEFDEDDEDEEDEEDEDDEDDEDEED